MTSCMLKVVMRPETKSQKFGEVIASIRNGLEFYTPVQPGSFLQRQCKNEWRGPPSHIKQFLTTSVGNCTCG